MQEFSFKIDESLDLCRRVLESATDRHLGSWSTLANQWKRRKATIVSAICPETARMVESLKVESTFHAKQARWNEAHRFTRIHAILSERWNALNERMATIDEVPEDSREAVRERTAKQMENNRLLREAVSSTKFEESLRHWRMLMLSHFSVETIAQYTITSLKECRPNTSVKTGQKQSRALATWLTESDCLPPDLIPQVVDIITTDCAVPDRTLTVVLSANPLDLLLGSEMAVFTSCHSLDGGHRAGSLGYLTDGTTVIGYVYDPAEVKIYRQRRLGLYDAVSFPFKLARQLAYMDTDRGAAAMMRVYGESQCKTDDILRLWRKMAALTLAKIKGGNAPSAEEAEDGAPVPEPKWYWARDVIGKDDIGNDTGLPYVDDPRGTVQLTRGEKGRPQVSLSESITCPCCGDDLDNSESLICDHCEDSRVTCYACNARIGEEDARADGTGETYCDDCYSERYGSCDRCGEETRRDDLTEIGNRDYCSDCRSELFTECATCGEWTRDHDLVERDGENYCSDCAPEPEDEDEDEEPEETPSPCQCGHDHDAIAERVRDHLTAEAQTPIQ